jgi:Ca-activated chloride channel family protein
MRRYRYMLSGAILVWTCVMTGVESQARAVPPQVGIVITGSIVDEDLSPLAGVTATLTARGQPRRTATSDEEGEFQITGVPVGDYQLRTALTGHTTVAKRVQVHRVPGRMRVGLVMASEDASLPMVGDRVASFVSAPFVAAPALPAATRNAIYGTVTDTSGGVIPGATITVSSNGRSARTVSNNAGAYQFVNLSAGTYQVVFELAGFTTAVRTGVPVTSRRPTRVDQAIAVGALTETVTVTSATPVVDTKRTTVGHATDAFEAVQVTSVGPGRGRAGTASYAHMPPNQFVRTADDPRSTFGADIDTASYTNIRRFLNQGQLPPSEAVRVEEFVNYFTFDYPQPEGDAPIGLTSELGDAPWAPGHKLVLIGAHARAPEREISGRNFVLLVDVSGSMQPAERLPLLKSAFALFVDSLQPNDEVSIVTYAGTSGVWLLPTPARQRDQIQDAITRLTADGSTNGGAGLALAYRLARQQFVPGGINRVLLATDGDFNVGMTANLDLVDFIERERRSGVFLSVLGVGTNNLQDDRMELLADKGNGHYAYLDSLQEARRVLIREAASTLEAVAQDVKFQVEFNPAKVQGWRLIGYENRRLDHAEFNDDSVDAGELGDGHTVTVLYEIVPAGAPWPGVRTETKPPVDPLIYQMTHTLTPAASGGDWLTVRVRYQAPGGGPSQLVSRAVRTDDRAVALPFAAMVVEFAQLLRDERRAESATEARWDRLLARIRAHGDGPAGQAGERAAFAEVAQLAAGLSKLERRTTSGR